MAKPETNSVREFRAQFGVTQARLGEMLGMKPATVSHWETGRRVLPESIARRLAQLRAELESSPALGGTRTLVIGEARMSDGLLLLYPWDAQLVTVPTPLAHEGQEWRAVILRDEGRNVEINGWIAFFSIRNEIRGNVLAIIKLTDGGGFCGFLRPRAAGGHDLESFFGENRIDDVDVESCYPILWMKAPSEVAD